MSTKFASIKEFQEDLHNFAADKAFELVHNPGSNYEKLTQVCRYIEGKTNQEPTFRSQRKKEIVAKCRIQYAQAAKILVG